MKIRPAAGSAPLDFSMANVREVSSMQELMTLLQKEYYFWSPTEQNVTIEFYCRDERIGWDTHLICIDGKAALFSDGPGFMNVRLTCSEREILIRLLNSYRLNRVTSSVALRNGILSYIDGLLVGRAAGNAPVDSAPEEPTKGAQ